MFLPFGRHGYSAERVRVSGCSYRLAGMDTVLSGCLSGVCLPSGWHGCSAGRASHENEKISMCNCRKHAEYEPWTNYWPTSSGENSIKTSHPECLTPNNSHISRGHVLYQACAHSRASLPRPAPASCGQGAEQMLVPSQHIARFLRIFRGFSGWVSV